MSQDSQTAQLYRIEAKLDALIHALIPDPAHTGFAGMETEDEAQARHRAEDIANPE
jgi:low affinity Fe/Cu permease